MAAHVEMLMLTYACGSYWCTNRSGPVKNDVSSGISPFEIGINSRHLHLSLLQQLVGLQGCCHSTSIMAIMCNIWQHRCIVSTIRQETKSKMFTDFENGIESKVENGKGNRMIRDCCFTYRPYGTHR